MSLQKPSRPSVPLDADALAVFLAVAEQGGVLAAARAIARSQPAVSARVRQLEASLGVALFLRTPQGMTLTAAGRELAGYARRMRTLLSEAERAVTGGADGAPQKLTLVASTTPAAFVLAPLIAAFARRRALAGLELLVGNTEDVLAAVREGTSPLGVVEGLARAPGVSLEPFCPDELVPVYAPEHVGAAQREALARVRSVRDLVKLPLLWREPGSGTRRVVERALRASGVPARDLRYDYVLGGTLALKAAALAGLGVAFLPRCAIVQELLLRQLVPIGKLRGLRIPRSFYWARSAGGVPPLLAEFQSFAHRELTSRRAEG